MTTTDSLPPGPTTTTDSLPPGLTSAEAVARGILTDDPPNTLRGRALRFLLVDILRQHDSMTVAELVATLADQGFRVAGRASKTISDALRWERARGRVVRVRRGLYRYGRPPKSTARRIRIFAQRCRDWLVALTRTQQPTPTRPAVRPFPIDPPGPPSTGHPGGVLIGPHRPAPWDDFSWLWAA